MDCIPWGAGGLPSHSGPMAASRSSMPYGTESAPRGPGSAPYGMLGVASDYLGALCNPSLTSAQRHTPNIEPDRM